MSALYLLLTSLNSPHPLLGSTTTQGLPVPPVDQGAAEPQNKGIRPGVMQGAVISDVRPEAIAPEDGAGKLQAETSPSTSAGATAATGIGTLQPNTAPVAGATAPVLLPTLPTGSGTGIAPVRGGTDAVAIAPQPILTTPRPGSNAQLFAQRIAALYAGQTYTRLAADSFRDQWVNTTGQPTYEQWVNLLAYESRAMANGQGNNRLTILVGDSISQWFPNEQLSTDRFWLNQSISGDNTSGILQRLPVFANTRPDTIHVMAGINDLRQGASDEAVMDNLRQIMRTLRRNHPQAQILIHSILPTRLPTLSSQRIQVLNASIAIIAQQEGVNYLDVMSYVSDENGNLRSELTTDGLHLNPVGYAMWNWVMRSLSQA